MGHARNAIVAHAQDFVVNDKMLLHVPKAFTERIRSIHARNA